MIIALIECWRQGIGIFHLLVDEAIVSLQDVKVLWGLRVDGLLVMLINQNRNLARKKDLIEEFLDFRLETRHFKNGRSKLVPIFDLLYESVTNDTPEELV